MKSMAVGQFAAVLGMGDRLINVKLHLTWEIHRAHELLSFDQETRLNWGRRKSSQD